MTDDVMKPELWRPRPVEETIQVYADWAETYDADVRDKGYKTPDRIASALADVIETNTEVLDYGCGTGLSGQALKAAGFTTFDGTDITAEMVDFADKKGIYRQLWVGEPGVAPCPPGSYGAIVAMGVVSLGAAPPECFDLLLDVLTEGGVLALSFNDPTLADGSYEARLTARVEAGDAEVVFREHGPHLTQADMNSDVIVLRRT